jgi:hypothetical protein
MGAASKTPTVAVGGEGALLKNPEASLEVLT